MSSSNYSPCAACKFLRRKCTEECAFAPYFPADQPHKFACVHRVFGASNVSKILSELNPAYRLEAVNSLFYEAETRLHDPVYGCVGLIAYLQRNLKLAHMALEAAKLELATYTGQQATHPNPGAPMPTQMQMQMPFNGNQLVSGNPSTLSAFEHEHDMSMTAIQQRQLYIRDPQQIMEAQRLAADVAVREQEYQQQQQQQIPDLLRNDQNLQNQLQGENARHNGGFDNGLVTATGFNQMDSGAAAMASPLSDAIGRFVDNPAANHPSFHGESQQLYHHQQHQDQSHIFLHTHPLQLAHQQMPETQPQSENERGSHAVGPSC